MLRKISAVPLLLALAQQVAYGGECTDRYEVTFGVRPAGAVHWLSPPQPFEVAFPATMESSVEGVSLQAKVQRLDERFVLIEYVFSTRTEGVTAALVRLELSSSDRRPFAVNTIDEKGVGWAFSARSLCTEST